MIAIWILAVVFLIDSLFRIFRTSFNLGSFLMLCITVGLWVYALFRRPVNAFCAHGVGRILKVIFFFGVALMLALMLFVAFAGNNNRARGDEKVVIILGAGLQGKEVSGLLAQRLDVAYDYYIAHPNTLLVVTGGQGPQEIVSEASAMRAYLMKKGVPEKQILSEDKSTSTRENFTNAHLLLQERGMDTSAPIAFATNQFHCYRAAETAKQAGFSNIRSLPAKIGLSSILPCYMREALAVLFYLVFEKQYQ